jgi:hypothetical protein
VTDKEPGQRHKASNLKNEDIKTFCVVTDTSRVRRRQMVERIISKGKPKKLGEKLP